jgi:hypothetical protein
MYRIGTLFLIRTFNEDGLFDGNLDRFKDHHVSLDELSGLLTRLEQSNILDTFPESHPTDSENEE